MTTRRIRFGLGVALSLSCIGLSAPVLAQQDSPTPSSDTAADTTPAPAETPKDAPKEEAKPTEASASASAEASAKVEAPAAPPAAAAPPPSNPERDRAVVNVGLERLTGSAYPEPRTRGISGGSLSGTMHGLQWPYMPMLGDQPGLRVGISGSIWNDLSYARIVSGNKQKSPSLKRYATQGRAVLRLTPTYSTAQGWFAQGQAELVANGDQVLNAGGTLGSTDDLFVRVGKWDLFDFTVGRYQGWEVFHYGMGLDLNTLEREGARIDAVGIAPAAYGLSYFWDRQDYRLGNYALHLYPTNFLRFELLGQLGGATGVTAMHAANFRPIGILDFGFVKLKAGIEQGSGIPLKDHAKARDKKNGFGGALQFVLPPWAEAGVSYAKGFQDIINNDGIYDVGASSTNVGMGMFANVRPIGAKLPLVLGFGTYKFQWEDLRPGKDGQVDYQDQYMTYFAIQYSLWDSIYFKFVGSHAHHKSHDFSRGDFSNNMLGGRFRMAVVF